MNRAVFLDKDGTLIRDIPYNADPGLISLMPSSIHGLQMLQDAGYLLILVSNQPGIALGYFTEADLDAVLDRVQQELEPHNIRLTAIYYCPHHPGSPFLPRICICRKPFPGLLLQAARDFDIRLADSWMIGDILNDMEAGKRAGCRTILTDHGNETEWQLDELRRPDFTVGNLDQAAGIILSQKEHSYAFLQDL